MTPLHTACSMEIVDLARLLIENGADVSARNEGGFTPFHQLACSRGTGRLALAQLLIENGADEQVQSNAGTTPFHLACSAGNLDLIRLYLNRGGAAIVNAQENSGMAALHIACKGNRLEVVQLLLSRGADVTAKTVARETPLHIAAGCDHLDIVWYLVRQFASSVLEPDEELD